MRQFLNIMIFVLTMLVTIAATYAFAGDTIVACTQPDGSTLYTNKDVKGCKAVKLPELSIIHGQPVHPDTNRTLEYRIVPQVPTILPTAQERVESETVTKTCALYKEWILINERTKGGFEYNDVEDTKHRLYLTKIFGSGFSPSMCKE